jgi:putative ABC transport system permease protein
VLFTQTLTCAVQYGAARQQYWNKILEMGLLQDVRFAVRTFRKNPGPIVLAILAAALGIGANTAIFSVIRGVLLRPLPYLEPDRLVVIRDSNPAAGTFHENSSSANFLDWRDQNQVFASMAAYADWVPAALIDGEPEQLMAEHISANFFATLGVRPTIGRDFTEQEDQLGRNDVVILSDGFWARRYGRDRAVLGQKIVLDNAPYTIVGVMPARFVSPNIGQRRRPVELWRPLAEWTHEDRSARYMRVIARLKPGVPLDVARARMADLSRRLGRIYPEDAGWETDTHRLDDEIAGGAGRPLWTLMAAFGLLLMIACANIANLLLARATTRHQEFAIRSALGGRRSRLFRQVLTEALMLSGCGSVLAVLFAFWARGLLVAMADAFLGRAPAIRLDLPVFVFAAAVSALAGLAFGSIPAFQSASADISQTLKASVRTTTPRTTRIRAALMIVEFAVALVLLTGAGLLLNSFRRMQSLDLGFRQDHVLVGDIRLRRGRQEIPSSLAYMTELLDRVKLLPGVESAAVVEGPPLWGGSGEDSFTIEGRPPLRANELQSTTVNFCTPEYFHLLELRLIRGRLFDQHDGPASPPVVVIDETMARRYFPNEYPIGKRLKLAPPEWQTVVGIVADVRQTSIIDDPVPQVYFPYAQHPLSRMRLLVRSAGDPAGLVGPIRREMSRMHPLVPLAKAGPLDETVSAWRAPGWFMLLLLASCAGLAVVLAAVGIYAVMSYTIAERTREIGVRIALGARPFNIVALIVRQGGLVTAIGLAAGLTLSLIFGHVLQAFLYGITPHDPVTLIGSAVFLAAIALAAMLVPALKATRLDPIAAIRCE